jgi:hypothetical protein
MNHPWATSIPFIHAQLIYSPSRSFTQTQIQYLFRYLYDNWRLRVQNIQKCKISNLKINVRCFILEKGLSNSIQYSKLKMAF